MRLLRKSAPFSLWSLLALVLMLGSLLALAVTHALFSTAPLAIAVQCLAFALMLWARITFGRRSFHAGANSTAGGLVTTGPYRYIRHPIYTAACLFGWAGVLANESVSAALLGLILFFSALVRMLCEERLLTKHYPQYREYAIATKRMIPGVF